MPAKPSSLFPNPRSALVALALLALLGEARGDTAAAAEAFSRAQSAELRGDYQRAAELYELAHQTIPAKEALRSATRARRAAGQKAHAATHAHELLRRYADDPASRELAREVITELGPKLALVAVHCQPPCRITAGGGAPEPTAAKKHFFFVEPGPRRVAASFGSGRHAERMLDARAGQKHTVELAPAQTADRARSFGSEPDREGAAPPEARRGKAGGLSPVWVAISSGVTLGFAAASIWSGLDVLERHEVYEAAPTQPGYRDGLRRERRTNLLFAATGAAAVATGILALFAHWEDGPSERRRRGVSLGASSRSAAIAVHGRF